MSSFTHVNFAINGKYSKNNFDNPNYYASFHDLSNVQKNCFKECPLTWMVPLAMLLH
jgi:hypothetical protein